MAKVSKIKSYRLLYVTEQYLVNRKYASIYTYIVNKAPRLLGAWDETEVNLNYCYRNMKYAI